MRKLPYYTAIQDINLENTALPYYKTQESEVMETIRNLYGEETNEE